MAERAHRAGHPAPDRAIHEIRAMPQGTDRRTACLLCYLAGLRIAEALDLTWVDCQVEPGYLYVACGKGGRPRLVPMAPELEQELAALARQRHQNGGLKPTEPVVRLSRGAIQKWLARHLDIGPHQLRHRCGYELGRVLDIDQVAKFLGHSSSRTTERYRHANAADIRRALGWEDST